MTIVITARSGSAPSPKMGRRKDMMIELKNLEGNGKRRGMAGSELARYSVGVEKCLFSMLWRVVEGGDGERLWMAHGVSHREGGLA
jgi:hypothetical protein